MHVIAAVVLIWLATSLVIAAALALATYRRPPLAAAGPPVAPRGLPRPRATPAARRREHVGSL